MIRIPIGELVKLKEEGMTDKEIAEYFTEKGLKICAGTVNSKLKIYYKSVGKSKPRGKMIKDKELEIMKEQRKSDREIAEYFTSQGRKITLATVNKRINKHYTSKGKIKPQIIRKNIFIKNEISNEEIIELRNKGMSLREISQYFLSKGEKISHTAINSRLKNAYETEENDLGKKMQPEEKSFRERLKVTNTPIITEKTIKSATMIDKER